MILNIHITEVQHRSAPIDILARLLIHIWIILVLALSPCLIDMGVILLRIFDTISELLKSHVIRVVGG